MTLTLFGSDNNRRFDEKKSLSDNFNVMCKLSWYQPDSVETQSLKSSIEKFDFDMNKDEVGEKEKMARLEGIILAIKIWIEQRRGVSTRVLFVGNYLTEITQHQTNIVKQYMREKKMRGKTCIHPLEHPDAVLSLPDMLMELFNQLKQKLVALRPPQSCIQF